MPRQDLIQIRRGTAAQWTSADPTLADGEFGLETDTNKLKCGDGSTAWTSLDYISGGSTSPTSDTGTTITFTENTFYNEQSYLTSGNLTLDLTGAVANTYAVCWCQEYVPTISGEDFFKSGDLDSNTLNVLYFYYDGTQIVLKIVNIEIVGSPTLSLTPGDEEIQIDWASVYGADTYIIERSTDNFATAGTQIYSGALLTYTDTGLTNGTTYYYRGKCTGAGFVDGDYGSTSSDEPTAFNPLTNILASYSFESDGSDFTTNYDLTEVNSPSYVSGKVSNCVSLNGSTQGFTLADNDNWSFGNATTDTPFSISFWANFPNFTGLKYIVSKFNNSGSQNEWRVIANGTNIAFGLNDQDTSNFISIAFDASGLSTSTWYHFVFTYDGSSANTGIECYLNGALQSVTRNSGGTYVAMENGTAPVAVGYLNTGSNYFDGDLDELHIWRNRELLAAEISELYATENAGTSIWA